MKRSSPEQVRAWRERSKPLQRKPAKPRRRAISPASPAQRVKVGEAECLNCGQSPCDPAHLIDRSLAPGEGADHPLAVVPLCRSCHRKYDEAGLDLLSHLEPHYRKELAFAVERFGLMPTLRRVTGQRWVPETSALDQRTPEQEGTQGLASRPSPSPEVDRESSGVTLREGGRAGWSG